MQQQDNQAFFTNLNSLVTQDQLQQYGKLTDTKALVKPVVNEIMTPNDFVVDQNDNKIPVHDLSFWELHGNHKIVPLDPRGVRERPYEMQETSNFIAQWQAQMNRICEGIVQLQAYFSASVQQLQFDKKLANNRLIGNGGSQRDETWGGGNGEDQVGFLTLDDAMAATHNGRMIPGSSFTTSGMDVVNYTAPISIFDDDDVEGDANAQSTGGGIGYQQYRQLMQETYHDSMDEGGYVDDSSGLYMPEFTGVSTIQQQQLAQQAMMDNRDLYFYNNNNGGAGMTLPPTQSNISRSVTSTFGNGFQNKHE